MWPMFISFAALEKDFNQWDPLIDGKDDNLIQGTNVTVLQSSIWMVSSGYIATNGCTESPPSTVLKMGGKRPATSTLTPFTRPVWASPHVVRVKGRDKVWCYLHGTIHVCQHHYWTVSTVFNHTQFFFPRKECIWCILKCICTKGCVPMLWGPTTLTWTADVQV